MLKILNIQTPKYRTLPTHAKSNLHELIIKLNKNNPTNRHITQTIESPNNKRFGKVIYDGDTLGETTFNLSNSTFVTVHSLSGDVVKAHKPIYKSWKTVFKKIDVLLTEINKGR